MLSDADLKILSGSGERILLVSPNAAAREQMGNTISAAGFAVETAPDAPTALTILEDNVFDLVLTELELGEHDGLYLIRKMRDSGSKTSVIVMDTEKSAEHALNAIRSGAYDYLNKPISEEQLLLTLHKALEREHLKDENEILKTQVTKRYSFNNIVARSPAMLEIFETIKKISDYKTTIMLYGESGTGKEMVAKAIHYNSIRRNRRFIAINCGAIPDNLLESELFGHKRGAFTDALRDKKGLFEEAEGGTILLDEIGELPLHLQVKLLRVLQENEIRPVGESRLIPTNVRIIAATLRDLENDVLDGRFRDDLYYRLNVISIRIPPLRERKEDIPVLVSHFIKKHQEKLGLTVYGISKDALATLLDHDWPGNIRELENCIERAMILTDGEEITQASLPKSVKAAVAAAPSFVPTTEALSIKVHSRALEETLIRKALERTGGNRTHAAKLLEISHRTLLYKLKEYNLVDKDEVVDEDSAA
ncbi:MAG: sigma-54 dependent transcriptional regulator [Bdellovibrionota bacterium]